MVLVRVFHIFQPSQRLKWDDHPTRPAPGLALENPRMGPAAPPGKQLAPAGRYQASCHFLDPQRIQSPNLRRTKETQKKANIFGIGSLLRDFGDANAA